MISVSASTWILASLFLPLFPQSILFNQILGLLRHPVLRAGLLLLWPQVGIVLVLRLGEQPPAWISWWAVSTALLYAFRLLAVRDVHRWIGFLAVSQWSLLWLWFQVSVQHPSLVAAALGFTVPLALTAFLASGLDRRFGAAYTHLYGGLASLMPRFSAVLAVTVLAAIATPLFPGFFIILRLLLSTSSPALLLLILMTALFWSWAGIRLLQGLLVGPADHAEQVPDLRRGLTLVNVVALIALAAAGLDLAGSWS